MVTTTTSIEHESGQEARFQFGKNWERFVDLLDDDRIKVAEESLMEMLEISDLKGKTFLDIGSGSGLFSLAARNLGASVVSFDYDKHSVACTNELKKRYWPEDKDWNVNRGDVLDSDYLESLGKFDVVYSWGVLHHTGDMWAALRNVTPLVSLHGKLFIAIYNDQGQASKWWLFVKKAYNKLPRQFRWIILWPSFLRLWGPTTCKDFFRGKPFSSWRKYRKNRGMSPMRDVIDWVGGFPFEVATPDELFLFCKSRNFILEQLKTCKGGHGCIQLVFSRKPQD